jgi:hypothetical protein
MTKEIKTQHYLPFVYLNQFRFDIAVKERGKSMFYFDNGTILKKVPIDTQGAKKWFYRKENTKESEESFQKYESDWNTVIDNQRRAKYEDFLACLQIIMYHFRNTGIEMVDSKFARFESIQNAVYDFISQKILKLDSDKSIFEDPSHLHNFPWECRIINFSGFKLFTSDNPSILTINKSENGYGPFFIPISSCELLVAIDKNKYEFNSYNGTNLDANVSNAYVGCHSNSVIFYARPFSDEIRSDLWKLIFDKRVTKESRGKFEKERFIPTHPHYNEKFSFLNERKNI